MSQFPNQDQLGQNQNLQSQVWQLNTASAPSKALIEQCGQAFDRVFSRPEIGFTRVNSRTSALQAIESRAREISRTCTHMVVIGMGGSSLGGRALLSASPRPRKEF